MKSQTESKRNAPQFSAAEIFLSAIVHVIFVAQGAYTVYKSSLEKEDMLSFDLHPSWWFGRKMDDSDYEWRYFADFYSKTMVWYIGHALMGLALNHHLTKGRLYLNIVYSLVALSYIFGLKQLTFLICNVCLVYLTVIISRRKSLVWLVSLVILSLLNMEASSKFIMKLCWPDPTGTKYASVVYAMSLCHLRLVSFGIDLIDDLDKHDHLESFYRILAYTLYFPTFLTGPFHSYKKFINSITVQQEPLSWSRARWVIGEVMLLFSLWMLMEISLHYFYTSALQQEEYFLLSADNVTIFGLCLIQAGLFNLKYVVLYGIPILFGRLDGVAMPSRPCNLLVQHKASDIWKYFDVGLYKFIVKYIYIPLGGSRMGLSQQVLTMFVSFFFIGFWHGAALNIYIWVAINFLAIILERLHAELLKSAVWKNIIIQFGEEAALRIENLLMAPIGVLSLWSMFVFLGGQNVGYNMYKKLLRYSNLETRVTMLFVAYCHIVFSASLFDGSLMRNIKGLFTGSEHNTENHKSIDTNSIENQNNLTKKTKQKHY